MIVLERPDTLISSNGKTKLQTCSRPAICRQLRCWNVFVNGLTNASSASSDCSEVVSI